MSLVLEITDTTGQVLSPSTSPLTFVSYVDGGNGLFFHVARPRPQSPSNNSVAPPSFTSPTDAPAPSSSGAAVLPLAILLVRSDDGSSDTIKLTEREGRLKLIDKFSFALIGPSVSRPI